MNLKITISLIRTLSLPGILTLTTKQHLGDSPKSVYASVKCNYTKCNIINALKKIDNSIYLLGGDHLTGMEKILEEYKNYNPAIESIMIPDTKHLPQLEAPAAFHEMCETFLE